MLAFFCALTVGLVLEAGAPTIVIDGEFDDWERAATMIAAPPAAGTILGPTAALWQPDALYLAVGLDQPRNLQSMPGTLALVFQAEPGASFALRYRDRDAVLVLEFSPPNAGRGRFGARMLTADSDARQRAPQALAGTGVLSAPTFSAARFEIRIPRDVIPAAAAALALAYSHVRATEWSATVPLSEIASDAVTAARPHPVLVRPADSALRVLSWNVGGQGFDRHLELLATLVERWRIDLLLLDEAPPGLDAAVSAALRPDWNVIGGTSGGRQRGVLASIYPLTAVPEFSHLAYPDAALDLIEREGTSFMRGDLRLARAEGVAAAAAVLRLAERDWLLVSADLQCCGRDGSVEDRLRTHQAAVIRDAAERAAAAIPGLAGLLLGGDLNLVGSRRPLDVLAGTGALRLEPVPALQLDGRSNHTWAPPGDRFPPGRLDFLLHSSALVPVNAVVVEGADLSGEAWIAAELAAASDHLPLIADFRIRSGTPDGGSTRSGDR